MDSRKPCLPWMTLALVMGGLSPIHGQSNSNHALRTYDEIQSHADRLARGGRRKEAIEILEDGVRENPHHGYLRWDLGQLQYEEGHFDAALETWNQCRAQGFVGRGYLDFRIAELHGRAGRLEPGLDALEAAIRHGFLGESNRERLENTDWPEDWRMLPRFERLTGIPSPRVSRDRDARWRFDLEFLRERFRLAYPDLDLYGNEARFEAEFEALLGKVPGLSDAEVPYHLQSICAGLHDAHCQVYFTRDMRSQFSWGVRIFDGRSMIFAMPTADTTMLGQELVAIEGLPISRVYELCSRFCSADNSIGLQTGLERLVAWPEALGHSGVLAPKARGMEVTVLNAEGETSVHRLEVAGLGSEKDWTSARQDCPHPEPLYLSRLDTDHWFEVLEDDGLVYCQINQITEARPGDLGRFLDRMQTKIQSNPGVEAFILDLRYNGGGSSDFNPRIMAFIHSTPLLREPDGFFVFTGRRTASAAQKLVTDIEYATDALFVGEPASSRPNFIGESMPEGLPFHPDIQVSISTHYHMAGGGCSVDRRAWIPTDVAIPYTFDDYCNNVDPLLEWVRGRLKD